MMVSVEQAVTALQKGEVVAIPTETVYGLAADITQLDAIKRVFQLKNRPMDHPLIVHIGEAEQLSQLSLAIPDYVFQLAKHFWPGPLSIILSKTEQVSEAITGGQSTVAIRMPGHPTALTILRQLAHPVAAPSANRFGHISPTTAKHVDQEFEGNVPVVDGGRCAVGIESTIIDATDEAGCRILRQGIIGSQDIRAVIGDKVFEAKQTNIRAPGLLEKHYAPRKPLFIYQTAEQLKALQADYPQLSILSFSDSAENSKAHTMPNQPKAYAYQLYFQLRLADASDSEAIAIEQPPASQAWQAVLDRITRAAK